MSAKRLNTGTKAEGPTFCWHCLAQLHRAPGKGKGLFFFSVVIGPDGERHRVHGDCEKLAIADGAKEATPNAADLERAGQLRLIA